MMQAFTKVRWNKVIALSFNTTAAKLTSRLLCTTACGPASSFAVQKAEQSTQNRVDFVRERSFCRLNPSAVPIVYRSHLFVPISRESPSFLLDLIDLTPAASLHSQKKVHLTLYHLTYRYDVDAKWIERLATIFKEPKTEADGEANVASSNPNSHPDGSSSLTRVRLACWMNLSPCFHRSAPRPSHLTNIGFRFASRLQSGLYLGRVF
jgi:hypothetical protein